jgi:lipopolysaccharide O-acetyltransferase
VWLGEHVSVLPGVTIGKGCIIGANSVVAKDIPDYCIAVGCPARVIKRFSFASNRWERIN